MIGVVLKGRSNIAGEEQSILEPEQSQRGPPLPVGHFPRGTGKIWPWGNRDSIEKPQLGWCGSVI